jgi:hypothetical protein
MAVDPILAGGAIKLSYDAFRELLGYFGKAISRGKLDRQIEAAWRELLKGDASDDSVIESALEAAKGAGDSSPNRLKLEELFRNSKAHKKGGGAKAKKKPAGRKASKQTRAKRK